MIKLKDSNESKYNESHDETCQNRNFSYNDEEGNGSVYEVTKRCGNCSKELTETYLLDYTKKVSSGKRWSRDEVPKCDCGSTLFKKQKVNRKTQNKIVLESKCADCGELFEDHYSYQDASM